MHPLHDGHGSFEAGSAATLADVVRDRALTAGDRIAYTMLPDGVGGEKSITWAQLDARARALGRALHVRGAAGQRVLLALPSGLPFIESIFACWYAGAVIVPICLPRHQRVKHRLQGVVSDAGAAFALGTVETRQRLDGDGTEPSWTRELTWLNVDDAAVVNSADSDALHPARMTGDDVALLQYTSGSTGTPRGVVVTHANLMHNSAQIAEACGHREGHAIGGWLPLFHDMGLIGIVLQAAFVGTRCVLMPPERFLMRPWLWLKMVSDYGLRSSPAPNFAYDLCVDKVTDEHKQTLNLSGWRNALNGSEPVRSATLERFANAFSSCGFDRRAFFPCYGLAESTLFVTGPGANREPVRRRSDGTVTSADDPLGHVACGRTFGDTTLIIVDPATATPVPNATIGEIWVAGGSRAAGYWNRPDATAGTFHGRLQVAAGESGKQWLRTGDLGFIADGELFITGRLRDLIIIAGRNHFPVDVERTVEAAEPSIAVSGTAAFSVDVEGSERLVVVAEVRRELARPARGEAMPPVDVAAITRRVRVAVAAEHEAPLYELVLLQPGALPRTTSGKVSRRAARDSYVDRTLERLEAQPCQP